MEARTQYLEELQRKVEQLVRPASQTAELISDTGLPPAHQFMTSEISGPFCGVIYVCAGKRYPCCRKDNDPLHC